MARKRTNQLKSQNVKRKKTSFNVDPYKYKEQSPSWKFDRCDKIHPRWSLYHKGKFDTDLLKKLGVFEGLSWRDIERQTHDNNKSSSHFVKVNNLNKEAQSCLEDFRIFDDELFSLRITNKERIYGLLNNGIFNIIWYDKHHEIYPTSK